MSLALPQASSAPVRALLDKCRALTQAPCALAFSGGADSALLLYLLVACAQDKTQVLPLTATTPLQSQSDLKAAQALCARLGLTLQQVPINPLPKMAHNPPTRCYQCKRHLMQSLITHAKAQGCQVLVDGTNGDDIHCYRPGLQALQELKVISPLAQAQITKAQVRALLDEVGLQAFNRPSVPCLATRFAYGMELNANLIAAVGKAERQLQALGFTQLRLRVHPGSVARLEVPIAELNAVLTHRLEIIALIKATGLNYVTLDVEGLRSGSMDELL